MFWGNNCNLKQAKKIIFVFLVLTLVSSISVSAILMSTVKVNFAFAKKHDSSGGGGASTSGSGDNGGGTTTTGGSDNSNGGSGDTSNTTPTPPAATQQTCPDGSKPDANGKCPTTTPPTSEATPPTTPPSTAFTGNETGTAPSSGATPPATSPTSTPPLTPPTPQQQYEDCVRGAGGGVPGVCKPPPTATSPTSTPPLTPPTPQQQYEDCVRGAGGGVPGVCKPPPTATPTEQNTAPKTLIQQTCPPQPIDARGYCPGVDMRGGGLGLPPPQQARFNIPPDVMVRPELSDGSCPVGYHIDNGNCAINSVHKLPNGNCPVGAMMTTDNICVTTPVLPGTTTGPGGGGFIQMFPQR
jgi:hypothetical protein